MSDNSFDALSKLAAKTVSRRQTLGGLAAVLGGVFLSAVSGRTGLAERPCGPGRQQCGPICCPQGWVCEKSPGSPR
jgi:hypothetical protein